MPHDTGAPDLATCTIEQAIAYFGPNGAGAWNYAQADKHRFADAAKRREARDLADKRRALKLQQRIELATLKSRHMQERAAQDAESATLHAEHLQQLSDAG